MQTSCCRGTIWGRAVSLAKIGSMAGGHPLGLAAMGLLVLPRGAMQWAATGTGVISGVAYTCLLIDIGTSGPVFATQSSYVIARTVSGVEPDLAAMWSEGEERRHKALSKLVAAWRRAGVPSRDVTTREATDLMWTLSGPDVFRLLVVERKWSRRRFGTRLVAMLERALLDTPERGATALFVPLTEPEQP